MNDTGGCSATTILLVRMGLAGTAVVRQQRGHNRPNLPARRPFLAVRRSPCVAEFARASSNETILITNGTEVQDSWSENFPSEEI